MRKKIDGMKLIFNKKELFFGYRQNAMKKLLFCEWTSLTHHHKSPTHACGRLSWRSRENYFIREKKLWNGCNIFFAHTKQVHYHPVRHYFMHVKSLILSADQTVRRSMWRKENTKTLKSCGWCDLKLITVKFAVMWNVEEKFSTSLIFLTLEFARHSRDFKEFFNYVYGNLCSLDGGGRKGRIFMFIECLHTMQ